MRSVEGGLGQGRKGGWVVLFFASVSFEGRKGKMYLPVLQGSANEDWQFGVIQPLLSELALEELLNSRYSLLHTHLLPHPVVSPRNFIFLSVHLSAPTCLPLPLMWSDTALGSVTGRGRERSGRDQILERMKGLQ